VCNLWLHSRARATVVALDPNGLRRLAIGVRERAVRARGEQHLHALRVAIHYTQMWSGCRQRAREGAVAG